MNKLLATSLISVAAAQLLKLPIKYAETGRWELNQLAEAGGMPSSHSAGVASMATYVALKNGLSSVPFALASMFGLIVMYDAMGVRRHAGEIAVEVNELKGQVEQLSERHPGPYHRKRSRLLKERLGHLPKEVAGGALLGVAVGMLSYWSDRRGKRWGWG